MIEVFPKRINQEKVEAGLTKLVAAFLSVAEDLARENESPVAAGVRDINRRRILITK